jgi:hypothetical protein
MWLDEVTLEDGKGRGRVIVPEISRARLASTLKTPETVAEKQIVKEACPRGIHSNSHLSEVVVGPPISLSLLQDHHQPKDLIP